MTPQDTDANWIPFPDGRYRVIQAYLSTMTNSQAVAVEHTVVEAYTDPRGQRRIKGNGSLVNHLLVALLEEGDDVNLWLDLGGEFKFHLQKPDIKAGKLFAPHVQSSFQFYPRQPWEQITAATFEAVVADFKLLTRR